MVEGTQQAPDCAGGSFSALRSSPGPAGLEVTSSGNTAQKWNPSPGATVDGTSATSPSVKLTGGRRAPQAARHLCPWSQQLPVTTAGPGSANASGHGDTRQPISRDGLPGTQPRSSVQAVRASSVSPAVTLPSSPYLWNHELPLLRCVM